MIKKVVICGMGVMGGSLGHSLVTGKEVEKVVALVRRKETEEQIKSLNLAHDVTTKAKIALKDADLVVLAIPPSCVKNQIKNIIPFLTPNMIVTDICSVKGTVVKESDSLLRDTAKFVGSHPMTGTEKFGFDNFISDLYKGSLCIVTPSDNTCIDALLQVETFWENLGMRVVTVSAENHDMDVALISHLPHVLSYLLMNKVASSERKNDLFKISAGSFKDMTRISGSMPELWADIFRSNKGNLICVLQDYVLDLQKFIHSLDSNDDSKMFEIMQQAFSSYQDLKKETFSK